MKKKFLALLLAGCMILSMTACGGKTTDDTTDAGNTAEDTVEDTAENTTTTTGASKIVELGQYKGLTYTAYDVTVTDEDVEAEVQYQLSMSNKRNPLETATETSIVNIDYVGTKDGVAFEGGSAEGYELNLGNSNFIEGFAESIVGMKVGETKDCPMTFPADYHTEELAGADVVFTITVNDCWELVPSELNDEFAEGLGYATVEELYAAIRTYLEETEKQNADADMKTQLVQKALANSKFEISEDDIKNSVDAMMAEYTTYAEYYGYDLETYVTAATGYTMEQFEEYCRTNAIQTLQSGLLQAAILEEEGLELSDEEYKVRAEAYMPMFGYETLEEFEAAYTKEKITNQCLADMVMEVMVREAVVEE